MADCTKGEYDEELCWYHRKLYQINFKFYVTHSMNSVKVVCQHVLKFGLVGGVVPEFKPISWFYGYPLLQIFLKK